LVIFYNHSEGWVGIMYPLEMSKDFSCALHAVITTNFLPTYDTIAGGVEN